MTENYNISQLEKLEKLENRHKQIIAHLLKKSEIKICLSQNEFNNLIKEINNHILKEFDIEIFYNVDNIKYKGMQIELI